MKLAGNDESGDINGSDVTTEGSSHRSDSNGDESRFWQDDDVDYDTELNTECKCAPQLVEKEALSIAAVDSTKPAMTSDIPVDTSDTGEILRSRPCVEKSSDSDNSILSTVAPVTSTHMNQVQLVIGILPFTIRNTWPTQIICNNPVFSPFLFVTPCIVSVLCVVL